MEGKFGEGDKSGWNKNDGQFVKLLVVECPTSAHDAQAVLFQEIAITWGMDDA